MFLFWVKNFIFCCFIMLVVTFVLKRNNYPINKKRMIFGGIIGIILGMAMGYIMKYNVKISNFDLSFLILNFVRGFLAVSLLYYYLFDKYKKEQPVDLKKRFAVVCAVNIPVCLAITYLIDNLLKSLEFYNQQLDFIISELVIFILFFCLEPKMKYRSNINIFIKIFFIFIYGMVFSFIGISMLCFVILMIFLSERYLFKDREFSIYEFK